MAAFPTRRNCFFLACVVLTCTAPSQLIVADEIETQLQEFFGPDILSQPIKPPALDNPSDFFPLKAGSLTYDLLNNRRKTTGELVETMVKLQTDKYGCPWAHHLGNNITNFIRVEDAKNLATAAHIRRNKNRITLFSPAEVFLPANLKPGTSVKRALQVKVHIPPDAKTPAYTGTLNQTVTYQGAYRIKLPAGTFDAILITYTYQGQVGPANVKDTIATFYAKGIGKVASIEHRDVTAFLIYNNDSVIGKALKVKP